MPWPFGLKVSGEAVRILPDASNTNPARRVSAGRDSFFMSLVAVSSAVPVPLVH